MIHLTTEQIKKLSYELKHPNYEAHVKRDIFLTSLDKEIQINADGTYISMKV